MKESRASTERQKMTESFATHSLRQSQQKNSWPNQAQLRDSMNRMKITVLNGCSGIGKTTLLRTLRFRLPERSGVLDGDDVAWCLPWNGDMFTEWLNVTQDNLLACSRNLVRLNLQHLVLAFIFPDQERIDRLDGIFNEHGFSLGWIHLVADKASIRTRLSKRGVTKEDIFENSFEFNRQIADLAEENGFPCINTTDVSTEQLYAQVLELLLSSNKELKATDKSALWLSRSA